MNEEFPFCLHIVSTTGQMTKRSLKKRKGRTPQPLPKGKPRKNTTMVILSYPNHQSPIKFGGTLLPPQYSIDSILERYGFNKAWQTTLYIMVYSFHQQIQHKKYNLHRTQTDQDPSQTYLYQRNKDNFDTIKCMKYTEYLNR